MKPAARTPEELEILLEDAFVVRDRAAVAELFEDGAVLVTDGPASEARGSEQIARVTTQLWARDVTYVAGPRRVLQARDTALVVADDTINVLRRGVDGTWRYAIALMATDDNTTHRSGHEQ